MKATTTTMLLGSVLGGALVQLAVLACGKVSPSVLDAHAATDSPPAIDSPPGMLTFAGFSYHTNGFVKQSGWNPVINDILDYNTFGSSSYNTTTGTFIAPLAGYYRFDANGWSPTPSPGSDTRMCVGLVVNEVRVTCQGAQLSMVDSPLSPMVHVLNLRVGDVVSLAAYSPIDVTFGGAFAKENTYYFQAEYLGQ